MWLYFYLIDVKVIKRLGRREVYTCEKIEGRREKSFSNI